MEIRNGAASVHEAADLKSLSVRVHEGADVEHDLHVLHVLHDLHDLGVIAEGGAHAWLQIDVLKAAAATTVPAPDQAEWAKGFDGMIAYATSKGWTSADGRAVRAHIEPPHA